MMKGNGMGTNWRGLYNTTLLDAHSAWKHRADELSDSLKITIAARGNTSQSTIAGISLTPRRRT